MKSGKYLPLIILICIGLGFGTAAAQENLAQEVYAIFERNCLNCHGPHGSFTEALIIQSSQALIDTGKVIPGNPDGSIFYRRLIETAVEKRMPLGQPPLAPEMIQTIRQWIQVGAPDWNSFSRSDTDFITTEAMLNTIDTHIQSLEPFDRAFARYFTSTHLYNAGETTETLRAYQRALSKLVNSLSWGRAVTKPQPIDSQATIFYIDLRDYEWEIGTNRWKQIEQAYPYNIEFNAPTQTTLREKLVNLRQEMNCDVPFVYMDWFLATASLPPLYHDILDLPLTDRALETRLEVNIVENIRNAPGRRVWRAGFNDSGVSNHNRVVERHLSRYGAYWKSYDFAGSVGTQNIFTHPLSFTHEGGEIIFNLPNGLQAYYLSDAGGNRLDAAPISIVRNPAASDPTVRNGLSCIGCHTEGMKNFEDQVRGVVEQSENPPFDKARALRLYVEKTVMAGLLEEDTDRYRQALEKTGDVFGGIEPVQRFHEAFQRPLDASHAAAAVGLETVVFLEKIRENVSLQNLGLQVLENGAMKRDAWTSNFDNVISALNTPDSVLPPTEERPERIPGTSVYIPDDNLRAAITETLGKAPNAVITMADMATLTHLEAGGMDIQNLKGIELATNLTELRIGHNPISDLSPIAGLTKLREINFNDTEVADLSPLAGLHNLEIINAEDTHISNLAPLAGLTKLRKLDTIKSDISDISPLTGLTNLTRLNLYGSRVTDISPLRNLTKLTWIGFRYVNGISDYSPLAGLTNLKHLDLFRNRTSDISMLAGLINLETLILNENNIVDVSPLASLHNLETLILNENNIVDVSPLASLHNLKMLLLHANNIGDISTLEGIRENLEVFRWHKNPGYPQGGPKIEGPWLWLQLPKPNDSFYYSDTSVDYLAEASDGKVTEQQIATLGATVGDRIGDNVWLSGTLEPYNYNLNESGSNLDNLRRSMSIKNKSGLVIIYASITLYSPRIQHTKMFIGAGAFPRKAWLNGALVYNYPHYIDSERWNSDYQDFSPITLQKGKNVLLVSHVYKTYREISFFAGFTPGTEYMVEDPSVGYTFSESNIHAGDTFTLDIRAENVIDFAGWQFDISFDPAALEAVEVNEGNFLKTDGGTTFFQKGTIDNTTGKITGLNATRFNEDGATGTGTLLSVIFLAKAEGETQLTLNNFQLGSSTGEPIAAGPHEVVITIEGQLVTGDVNRDGLVNVLDMILVSRHFGDDAAANPQADVNRDGTINIQDLILVAQHLGESTISAAPSAIATTNNGDLTPAMVQAWIEQARTENDGSIAFRQGIANLERLLALFIPDETVLLHNYPNPFNPETWIPYQLAKPTEVMLTIYATNGAVVRTLELGHQPAGFYESRTRAAYWDGKNQVGEPVASGIYFYTLTAGDFNATRKMLIRK